MLAKVLPIVIVSVLLGACGLADDLADAMATRDAVQTELEDRYGLDAEVGFNINNGRLSSVTVHIKSKEVKGMLIDDLIGEIEPVVIRHFDEAPQMLVVSIVVTD